MAVATAPTGDPERVATGYTFNGKCRGFPQKERVGLLVGPQQEIEKIVEGEGYAVCKLIAGSPTETKILKECSSGSPCEIDGKLRVDKNNDLDVVDVQSVKSWKSWKGTCYGKLHAEGDGEYSVGMVDVEIPDKVKVPVRCGFGEESVSKKILAECPEGSICEVRGRFEKRPEASSSGQEENASAEIGYVDSVKMKEPPSNDNDSDSQTHPESKPDKSTSLGSCSAVINDPLRQMIIDTLVSGGKHLGQQLNTVKDEIERDYGSFLNVHDDATVEKVDERTGKIGCAVTYQADLQGLAGKVLEEGATARAQILIGQIAKEGKVISRRLGYTVQKTSGGSFMVWFGLPQQSSSPPRRRGAVCILAYAGRCAMWGVR